MVDVGGGTGFCTQGVVQSIDPKNVTLIDQSPHQMAKAKKKADLEGVTFVEVGGNKIVADSIASGLGFQACPGGGLVWCGSEVAKNEIDTLYQGDAEDLPFKTDEFDRYVSAGSIEYWPDPQRGICEAYRVIKPGGLACLIGPVHPTFWLSRWVHIVDVLSHDHSTA